MMKNTTNGNGLGPTDVGTWYCTYYNDDWDTVGGTAYPPTMYRPLCSDKPGDYRAYNSADISVIDYHLRQIANAKIDFILFELSPLRFFEDRPHEHIFIENARVVARRLKIWNDGNPWKIKYAIAAGAHAGVFHGDPIGTYMEKTAQNVYDTFYNDPDYGGPDNYYQLNGKQLLVFWGRMNKNEPAWNSYEGSKTYGDRFSIRYAQDVQSGSYGWNIYESGPVIHPEVEVASPGWGHYTRTDTPYVSRQRGDFYEKCWQTILQNPRPAIVMIVAFNDYWENTAVWTSDTALLTDADQWIGHDGKQHPSMYWDMTVRNIGILRGEND